jgi:hypothetical protein
MTGREFRLRLRIDRLIEERDRARASEARLRRLNRKWRGEAYRLRNQYELWRARATRRGEAKR